MEWINVNDKLPEEDGKYLVLYYFNYTGFRPDILSFYRDTKDKFFFGDEVPKNSKNIFVYYDSDCGHGVSNMVKYWCEIPDYSTLQ